MKPLTPDSALLQQVIDITYRASDAIMTIYMDNVSYTNKSDGSPLTVADLASHDLITKGLTKICADVPILSEEGDLNIKTDQDFWLVDPLDGTKEFIKRNGEFTVNIALVRNKQPILGVIAAPALDCLYAGIKGHGAWKVLKRKHFEPIKVTVPKDNQHVVVGSRSHPNQKPLDALLSDYKVKEFIPVGSSLKFCKIAEGQAHLYIRPGDTMTWDTAAGQAILESAGGQVSDLNGNPLIYGIPPHKNPHFIAKIIS